MRSLIGATKLFIFFLSAIFTIIYQSTVLLFTKGEFALIYPRAYHAFVCRLLGIKVVVEGQIETGKDLVYLGNHLSYLDIQVVGSIIKGVFVAKKEIKSWPLFGLLGSMQRTIYISRDFKDAKKETNLLLDRLQEGLPLIIFPEGTSSSGVDVFPFKSSFFQIFLNKKIRLQPFTISILSIDEENVLTLSKRDKYAWYSDMPFAPHLWCLAKGKGAVIKVIFHENILSISYEDRKKLCSDVYDSVLKGLDLSALSS